jgi:hypothetical protein
MSVIADSLIPQAGIILHTAPRLSKQTLDGSYSFGTWARTAALNIGGWTMYRSAGMAY